MNEASLNVLGFVVFAFDLVDLHEMSPQVAALREVLLADLALEWPQPSVLPKMISQVARFLENTVAARMVTLEKQVIPFSVRVLYPDDRMPIAWCILESLLVSLQTFITPFAAELVRFRSLFFHLLSLPKVHTIFLFTLVLLVIFIIFIFYFRFRNLYFCLIFSILHFTLILHFPCPLLHPD